MNTLDGLLRWALELLKVLFLKVICPFKNEQQDSYQLTNTLSAQSIESAVCKYQHQPIPTVKGLPLVGTLFDLIAAGGATQLHKYIDARHRQYGPIFRERLGGSQDAVFVASANLMRSVFLHEGQFPQHPLPDAWTLYNKRHDCQRGLFFMEGGEWFHNRRILNRLLLNGNLNWMDVHIEGITEQLVSNWRAQVVASANGCYELPDLEQQLYRWSIEVVCGIMFGSRALQNERVQSALDDFTKIVHKVFEHSSQLMTFPPALAQLLRLRIWREFEQVVGEVLEQGSTIIDMFISQQQSSRNVDEHHIEKDEALFHKLQSLKLPSKLIKRMFVDLVIAAGDTTAFSSQWAIYALSKNAVLQRRIDRELAVVPDLNPPPLLLYGLVKETLRLYPVAPFIGRYLSQAAELGGHSIEQGTLVLLSLYTAGRDASHFSQPLNIIPERWSSQPDKVLQPHGTLPFAIGQRSCIGRRVALKQLYALLGACATQFEMQCLNKTEVECKLRMVTVPDQTMRIALKLRDVNSSCISRY